MKGTCTQDSLPRLTRPKGAIHKAGHSQARITTTNTLDASRTKEWRIMAQVTIYGLRSTLDRHRKALSDAIHASVMGALAYPAEKRFHRFIGVSPEDFVHPDDRTDDYVIVEISMFHGRSIDAKKALIRALYANIGAACGITSTDIEITIFETPRENWGIRGVPGDELTLTYAVTI